MTSKNKMLGARLIILLAGAILLSLVMVSGTAPVAKAESTVPSPLAFERVEITQGYAVARPTVLEKVGPNIPFTPMQEKGQNGPVPRDVPFGPNVRVFNDAAAQDKPSMAVDPITNAIWIVFEHNTGTNQDVYLSVSTDDGLTWLTSTLAPFNTAANELNPSITITSTGILAFAYTRSSDPGYLYLAQSTDGGQNWGLFSLPLATWWSDAFTDIQFPKIASQNPAGNNPNGIVLVWQALCIEATNCNPNAHIIPWMGTSDFSQSSVTFDLGGYFYWPWIDRQGNNNIFVDSLHPSVAWSGQGWDVAFDDEWWVPDSEWKLSWVMFPEDGSPPPSAGYISRDVSQSGIYSHTARSGSYSMIAGTFRNASAFPLNPTNHNVEEFHTTDNWVSADGTAPFDTATTDQRSVSVAVGTGTPPLFHFTYYSNTIMTDWYTDDAGTTWNGPQKVSDNAGTGVNADRATSVYLAANVPKVAWQDNRNGNDDIYFASYVTWPIWINSTCGGVDTTGINVVVDGNNQLTSYNTRWGDGSQHIVRVSPTSQQFGLCKKCEFSRWTNYPYGQASITITVSGPTVLVAEFNATYRTNITVNPSGLLLTVSWAGGPQTPELAWGFNPPGQYFADTVTPQTTGPATRYRFIDWSDGTTTLPKPVTVTGPGCTDLTANFAPEYLYTIQTVPPGLKTWVDGSVNPVSTFWAAPNTNHRINTTSPQPGGAPDVRYRFTDWAGGPTTDYWDITVPGSPQTYTANFKRQYLITLRANYENPGPFVSSNIVPYVAGDTDCRLNVYPPVDCWADENSAATLYITTPQATGGQQYIFLQWQDGNTETSRAIGPVTAPATYTSQWSAQFYLTMNVDSASCGSSTVSPSNGWHTAGDPVQLGWQGPSPPPPTGERYRFKQWVGTGQGSYSGTNQAPTIYMNDVITETAYCYHEYRITVDTDPTGVGLVYEVGGIQQSGNTQWWTEQGLGFWVNVTQTTQGTGNTRYIFERWSDGQTNPNHPKITVLAAQSVTAIFRTEHKLTLSPTDKGDITCTGGTTDCWYKEGDTATITIVTDPWPSGAQWYRWKFTSWSGDLTGSTNPATLPMTGPKTVNVLWTKEFKLTLTTARSSLTCAPNSNCWFSQNAQATVTLAATTVGGGTGTQYVFTGWTVESTPSGTTNPYVFSVDSPKNITANWKTQYELTVTSNCGSNSDCGSPTVGGWKDAGTDAEVSVTSPYTDPSGKIWNFAGWTQDATGTNTTTEVHMDGPKTAAATWTEKPKEQAGGDIWVWLILIVVIIVVVALVLFFMMKRKKPAPAEEELPPEAPPARAPPAKPPQRAPAPPPAPPKK